MLSDVTKSAIAVSVTVLGSVFLICGCLYLRRYKKNKRNASNPEESKSDIESAVKDEQGITNTACEDVYESADIYETCKESNIYDYATVERPNRKRFKTVQEDRADLENNSPDCEDGRVYDVLEAPSEEAVTSDPIYFTLERGLHQAPGVEPENGHEEYSGSQDDIGIDGDIYVINIQDEVYDNEETGDDMGSRNERSHGIGDVTEELDDNRESKDNKGYTGDEKLYENVHKQVKEINEALEEEDIYVIGNDEVEDESHDDGNNDDDNHGRDDNHDHGRDENPDEEIYENWENETIARKSQVCDDSLYWNEENDAIDERGSKSDHDTNQDQDSGVDSMYENLKDIRNLLHGSIEKIVTEVA